MGERPRQSGDAQRELENEIGAIPLAGSGHEDEEGLSEMPEDAEI